MRVDQTCLLGTDVRMKDMSHARRGMELEAVLCARHEGYRRCGLAVVKKMPTRMVDRGQNRDGTRRAVYQKITRETALPDYLGRVGDRPVAIEAKEEQSSTIDLDRVTDMQMAFLEDFGLLRSFVYVRFRGAGMYLIPAVCWHGAIAASAAGRARSIEWQAGEWEASGKKSIREDQMDERWRVSSDADWIKNYMNYMTEAKIYAKD